MYIVIDRIDLIIYKKILFQYIKLVNLSEYELRLIAKNRSIKNCRNLTREKHSR